jgi:hypothetical protein
MRETGNSRIIWYLRSTENFLCGIEKKIRENCIENEVKRKLKDKTVMMEGEKNPDKQYDIILRYA